MQRARERAELLDEALGNDRYYDITEGICMIIAERLGDTEDYVDGLFEYGAINAYMFDNMTDQEENLLRKVVKG